MLSNRPQLKDMDVHYLYNDRITQQHRDNNMSSIIPQLPLSHQSIEEFAADFNLENIHSQTPFTAIYDVPSNMTLVGRKSGVEICMVAATEQNNIFVVYVDRLDQVSRGTTLGEFDEYYKLIS